MRRKWVGTVAVAAAAVLGAAPAVVVSGGAGLAGGHAPIIRLRQGTSSNWSGYAAYGAPGQFTSVSGSWTQPSVSCSSQNASSSYWVGLDGYSDSTVEQLGTEGDCVNGAPRYYAWFEMYPRGGHLIGLAVVPTHIYRASVQGQRGSFAMSLTDVTARRTFTTTQRLNQARGASAEVIVEAPSNGGVLPLANFGTTSFTGATANGSPLGGFSALDPITMQDPYGMTATPLGFDASHTSFSVIWSSH
jgi:hypothetical protein